MKELITIQQRLVCKKDKTNKFGGYNYRSAEGILEAVKPLAHHERCFILLTDRVEQRGDRYYVIATATITNAEGQSVSVTAEAREEDTKKGMDAAQITGSASSYARKYALCGLFAIDDGVDPDSTNKHGAEKNIQSSPEGIETAIAAVYAATDKSSLLAAYNAGKIYENNALFKSALSSRKKELGLC